jgi:oligosaccharide reducing-end xylanase
VRPRILGAGRRPMPTRLATAACLALSLAALGGCHSTTDSLGYNGPGGITLRPIQGPETYPNVLRDVLGKSDEEIADKIDGVFDQLFHGDATLQAIYFTSGSDQAYIKDIFHGDIRTEGIGYALLICVELNKRDEFDRLWRYAKANLQQQTGPSAGYFNSVCEPGRACLDPFGLQQMVMALLFAHDRWSGITTTIDYGTEAIALFDLMRHKLETTDGGIVDGGVVDGANDTFDSKTALVFDVPIETVPPRTRPSIEMPAYYELWAQATGDGFWRRAASSARAYWKLVAHPETGLVPWKSDFEGNPISGYDFFNQEAYRTQINIVLDAIWSGSNSWAIDENNKLLRFFISKGINSYGGKYSLDGKDVIDPAHDPALVFANGVSAVIATVAQRQTFISQAFDTPTPVGTVRYYQGLIDLVALLILGGRMVVY